MEAFPEVADSRHERECGDDREPEVEEAVDEDSDESRREPNTHSDERDGQSHLDESRAPGRKRPSGQDVRAGVCEHEERSRDLDINEPQGRPQAKDVAEPVEGVAEDAEPVLAWVHEQFANGHDPATVSAKRRRRAQTGAG